MNVLSQQVAQPTALGPIQCFWNECKSAHAFSGHWVGEEPETKEVLIRTGIWERDWRFKNEWKRTMISIKCYWTKKREWQMGWTLVSKPIQLHPTPTYTQQMWGRADLFGKGKDMNKECEFCRSLPWSAGRGCREEWDVVICCWMDPCPQQDVHRLWHWGKLSGPVLCTWTVRNILPLSVCPVPVHASGAGCWCKT